jgi:hypothetical protein
MWSVLRGKWSFSAKSAVKRWCLVVPSLSGAPPAPSLSANAGSCSRSLTEKTRLGPEGKDWSCAGRSTSTHSWSDRKPLYMWHYPRNQTCSDFSEGGSGGRQVATTAL